MGKGKERGGGWQQRGPHWAARDRPRAHLRGRTQTTAHVDGQATASRSQSRPGLQWSGPSSPGGRELPGQVAALEGGLAVEAEDGVLDGGGAVAVEAGEDGLRQRAAALPGHLAGEHAVHDGGGGGGARAQRQQALGEAAVCRDDLPGGPPRCRGVAA